MAFGSEMNNCTRLVGKKQRLELGTIANIALHKHVPGILAHCLQIIQISCISQLIQIKDRLVAGGKPVIYEI